MTYTALQSDTDCDGTTWWAKRYATEEEAKSSSDTYEVMPEAHFLVSQQYANLDEWDRDYYLEEGYASLGARWNPWVEDDSIGIPALDMTNDPPLYTDDDILQAQYEMGW